VGRERHRKEEGEMRGKGGSGWGDGEKGERLEQLYIVTFA
jgi:hypothetical protein